MENPAYCNKLQITGLYPGHHNIIADQFADEERSEMNARYFDKTNEPTTGHLKWWADNKPIWASAR